MVFDAPIPGGGGTPGNSWLGCAAWLYLLVVLFNLPHNNYKKYRKSRKKEVARRPNRNYKSL